MANKEKIFISWSKDKSKKLADATKIFLENTLGNSIEFFFSPEMYKGTCVDNEIHSNLLLCKKCMVCITAENFKNPWLLYEAGVVYGANSIKSNNTIVIPILFEDIPEWSSWIDKPFNRYTPLRMQNSNGEFDVGKQNFKAFIFQIIKECHLKIKITDVVFNKNWEIYENCIRTILNEEQLIPNECKDIYNRILENDNGNFSITSPEVTKDKITFHKGFTTSTFIKVLTDTIKDYQGKYLWFYGRKNKKLLSRQNDGFFKYLADEGIKNGVDFRCLFTMPNSPAAIRASSKDRASIFDDEMKVVLFQAISLKNKFGLPIEKLFRLYIEPRTESIIRCDNAILYRPIVCDSEGYPLPYTNSNFEILPTIKSDKRDSTKGMDALRKFINIWSNDKLSKPLTIELFKELYPENKI